MFLNNQAALSSMGLMRLQMGELYGRMIRVRIPVPKLELPYL